MIRELRSPRRLGIILAVAAVYFVAGKLGLRLAFVHVSTTAVWPPTGIALAAFLIFGRRVWPAVLAGAFFVNLTTAGSVATSLGIAAGNTLEGLVGAYLVDRYARGRRAFDQPRDIFKFALFAAGLSTMASATIGVTTLAVGGLARWVDFGPIWFTWWLGDAGGDVVVAPLILLWSANPRIQWSRRVLLEGAALLAASVVVGQIAFGGHFPSGARDMPLEFLCMPIFIWAAFRFGRRASTLVIAIVYAVAVQGTLHGVGPFSRESLNESLLLLQAFTGVVSVTTLALAAVVAERRRSEEQLRQLAVSDPLTGLANYRYLMEALEREIQRSGRTERPFAVLFLDLDDLKKINDRHGHLVGSHALCRVAEILRSTCRAVDTAARYGGDEFALVLPETDEAAARVVASRVRELLALDGEEPRVTVSSGIAMYPRDGATGADLLGAADRAQYAVKMVNHARPAPPVQPGQPKARRARRG